MSTLGVILVGILVVILLGGLGAPYVNPGWQRGYGAGNAGIGVIGVILIVVLILVLSGRFSY